MLKLTFRYLITGALFILLLNACTHHSTNAERAVYYWKIHNWTLTNGELKHLKELEIQKMYVKFFEVEPDELFGSIPTAKMNLYIPEKTSDYLLEEDSTLPASLANINIVPTVFIRNEVFYNSRKSAMDTLADNIIFLCNKYYTSGIRNRPGDYEELHIDCDWTAKTKDLYFYLLKTLKKLSGKTISCTLRLYPYKYPDLMGIPPADKATLMCYNLVNPIENKHKNSIQINEELEKYLKNAPAYPLHLDIALPVFSWMQVYQNNQFAAILNGNQINLNHFATQKDSLWYEMTEDVEVGDIYLRIGDKIKLEDFNEQETYETIDLLKKYIAFDDSTTVTLFHLDEDNMKKYNDETYTHFFTRFSE